MFYSYKGFVPVVHPTAYVHEQATVIGNVVIGAKVYIGPGARLRGDWGGIVISDGCNVQENCTIHMFPGVTVKLESDAHIGHGAIIHGAHIGHNVMIGMNSVIMDNCIIGDDSIVGALTMLPANTEIPPRSLVVGNPGRVVRSLSEDRIAWKSKGTALYQTLPDDLREHLEVCQPLAEIPKNRPAQASLYQTLNEIKGQ